jgi:uncharacterized protein YceK
MVASTSQPPIARGDLLRCGAVIAVLSCFQMGCGTVVNLTANPQNESSFNSTTCYPMGGVTRALINGGVWTATGPTFPFAEGDFGENLLLAGEYTGAGIAELVIDAPLSFVADMLTLPLAYSKYQGNSYATKLLEAERQGAATREAADLPDRQTALGNAQKHAQGVMTADK